MEMTTYNIVKLGIQHHKEQEAMKLSKPLYSY
jgi:hypothetical protein